MRQVLLLLLLPFLNSAVFSQEAGQATLDQILAEVRALKEKVASLEDKMSAYENSAPAPVAPTSDIPPAAIAYAAANPPPKGDKNKWFENLRVELRKADVRASGNWVKPEAWDQVALKMKPEEVVAILGEPMDKKFSIRKDTDEIFIYKGDIDGDGVESRGEVRIYKGKVRRITPPNF